ncbi:VOC family protein [Aliifodinibius salicampi]|uniref:VOC family protein n=1 Tax=Fodinibius salicampi TaxID=1920655 RepID=A0ABT3PXC7_9BACT|nr:VOC family protein [Fodinibius salicampi]MCW9712514.1 VOC family protein [Fodinibius salicampi]
MIQANPYLTFDGNCREAMTFYRDCFGGELTLQTIAETPIADQCPAGMQDQIMHSSLVNGDFLLMATDMTQADEFITGNDMAISLNFDHEEEIDRCFSTLSREGNIIDPLGEKSWGALFGVVQDKFGKVWMLNFDKKQ